MSKTWLRLVPREGADASDIADVQAALNLNFMPRPGRTTLAGAFTWDLTYQGRKYWSDADARYTVVSCTEAEALAAASGHKCVCRYCGKEMVKEDEG
jgi:hypothetical protein